MENSQFSWYIEMLQQQKLIAHSVLCCWHFDLDLKIQSERLDWQINNEFEQNFLNHVDNLSENTKAVLIDISVANLK